MKEKILNKMDFKNIKLVLNKYTTLLELKLCDLAIAISNSDNKELILKLEKEYNMIEKDWSIAINLLRKLY